MEMSKSNEELRCHCGSLIARIVEQRLEVKCRRCRRVGVVHLSATAGTFVEIRWRDESPRSAAK